MIDVAAELGVQSYCFRHFKDHAEVAAKVKACGLARIELCGAHVDFSKPETFASVLAAYREAGVAVPSIGVCRIGADEAAARGAFEFARQADAALIAVDFVLDEVPEAYRVAERLAEEYDVRLGIHNHGGRHWLGNPAMIDHVLAHSDDRLGLCLDTAWALDAGADPVAMVERFGPRLYGVHFKDFVFDRARRPEDVVVGTGNLALERLREALEKADFAGAAVLEYEGDVENPVPALTKCVDAIRDAMAAGGA